LQQARIVSGHVQGEHRFLERRVGVLARAKLDAGRLEELDYLERGAKVGRSAERQVLHKVGDPTLVLLFHQRPCSAALHMGEVPYGQSQGRVKSRPDRPIWRTDVDREPQLASLLWPAVCLDVVSQTVRQCPVPRRPAATE